MRFISTLVPMNDFLTFFTQRDQLVLLFALLSFLVAAGIVMVAVFRKDLQNESIWKLFGTFLVVFLALLANNVVVYGLAVFIIATLVTNLQFLLDLASIFWNRSWWKVEKARPQDVKAKVRRQVQEEQAQTTEEGAISKISKTKSDALLKSKELSHFRSKKTFSSGTRDRTSFETTASVPESSAALERSGSSDLQEAMDAGMESAEAFDTLVNRTVDLRDRVLEILEQQQPFGGKIIQDLRLFYRGRPRHVIDAVLQDGAIHYLIEVRLTVTSDSLAIAVAELRHYMNIYRVMQGEAILVKGLLVVPENVTDQHFIDAELGLLYFDERSGAFPNVLEVRQWMNES